MDQSAFVTSKLNKIDDLLQETFNQKQNLTEANQEYLDRYLEVFKEKVQDAKQKRKYQKHLIEQLSKINETNKDLERKNQNLDRVLLNETRRHVEKKIEIDHSKSELM